MVDSTGGLQEEATDWLAALSGGPANTTKSYGQKVAAYLSWLAGLGLSWREPDLTVLTQWLQTVRRLKHKTGPRKGETYSDATVGAYKAATLNFYRWAVSAGHVSGEAVSLFFEWQRVPAHMAGELPTQRLVSARSLRVKVKDKAPQWIQSEEDLQKVLDVPMNLRDLTLVMLMFLTGMRIGECLSLFRADMHVTASSVALGCGRPGPHVHVRPDNEVINGMSVKDKHGRELSVPAWWVQMYADYQRERLSIVGADENPHVFVNLYGRNRGDAMKYDNAKDLFERLARVSGVHVDPHTLRHTRASWWLLGIDGVKVDARTVQELLGHRSLTSTNVYLHTRDEEKRAAVEAVAPRLRGEGAPDVTA